VDIPFFHKNFSGTFGKLFLFIYMKITRQQLRHLINEIVRRSSLAQNPNYSSKSMVMDVGHARMKQGPTGQTEFEFIEQPEADGIRMVAYVTGKPAGYMYLAPILQGYKVNTVQVSEDYRRGGVADPGFGVASRMYQHVISKYQLYSGDSQTPEARRLWVSLHRKYPGRIEAVDTASGETYQVMVAPDGTELEIVGSFSIWTDDVQPNGIYFRFKTI
jgi:hypothetical protein